MKFKKRLVGLMLTAALTAIPVTLAACNKGSGGESSSSSSITQNSGDITSSVEEKVPFEATGEYYCAAGESEYTFIIEDEACRLVMGAEDLAGTYTYDGTTLKISLAGGVTATATYDGTVLTLKKGNETFSFYEKVNYTVTFEVNGAPAIAAATVLNGKTLAAPEAPVKDNYWFVGWYSDSKYTSLYNFDTLVTSDITLYARFVEKVEAYEYDVNFVVDGEAYAQMTTKGGVIYNSELPTPEKEGKVFLGWWVSSYGSACSAKEQRKSTAPYEATDGAKPTIQGRKEEGICEGAFSPRRTNHANDYRRFPRSRRAGASVNPSFVSKTRAKACVLLFLRTRRARPSSPHHRYGATARA